MDLGLSDDDIERYSRHILLPEIGGSGQAKLAGASVLIVGAGGLGCPALLYLAAGGVGRITVVDDDTVELSNLQRQIAFGVADIGRPKAVAAAERARAINPGIAIEAVVARVTPENVLALVGAHDIVADGTDNFATRFLVADTCVAARKTLVSAAVLRFEGQLSTFKPHAGPDCPCYRCLYPEPPPAGSVAACSEAGVLGAVTGVMGTMQATEVVKEITGIGEGMAGRLLLWDALTARTRTIRLPRDPACPACGGHASLRGSTTHEAQQEFAHA